MQAGSDRFPKLDSQGAIFGALGIHKVPSSVLLQLYKIHGHTILIILSISSAVIDTVLD